MKKILVVIHLLMPSGAPISTKNICSILVKNNIHVELWSYRTGPLLEEYQKLNIPVKIVTPDSLDSEYVKAEIRTFDMLIANTVCTYEMVEKFQHIIPTIWYIHEAKSLTFLIGKNIGKFISEADNIFVVSEYARDFIHEKYGKKVQVMHNGVEDEFEPVYSLPKPKERGDVIRFLALGYIAENKAYDVFLHAFTEMDQTYRERCELHFAGQRIEREAQYYDSLMEEISIYDNVYYHGMLTDREEVFRLYQEADVVVVVSRDESCSLVALEGAMMQKPLIISRNVGAKYIVDQENGWVVETGSAKALRSVYQSIIDSPENLIEMGKISRQKYLSTSVMEIFEKNILQTVHKHMKAKTLFRLQKAPIRLWRYLYTALANPFPFLDIKRGSRIILYGAGKYGKSCHNRILKSHYFKLLLWVDQEADQYRKSGLKVYSPQSIREIKYDYIAIAVFNPVVVMNIRQNLRDMGVPEEKIVCLAETEF